MKIAIGVEYHGAYFQGWQSQPNGNGVQDAVERALKHVAGVAIRLHCAGRTDTGVHALMQVAHFETAVQRPCQAWVRGANAHLPAWVRIHWAQEVDDSFHARFEAQSRRYQYVLYNHAVAPGIQHGQVGWYHRPLKLAAMQEAAALLIGEHDFSAFRASECQAKTAVRVMMVSQVQQLNQYFMFDFEAQAFLQHQIRNMVGALVYVGQGKLSVDQFSQLLAQRDRKLAPPTFMSDGLYFSGVRYAKRWALPNTVSKLSLVNFVNDH